MSDLRRITATILKTRHGHLPKASGELPRQTLGDGRPCDGCEETISPTQIAFEVDVRGYPFRFHDGCFNAWKQAWQRFLPG